MKVAITGGGTGGHLVIAKALKEALVKRGHRAIFIGSTSGQDRMWFEEEPGFDATYFLPTTGVVNKRGIKKAGALWRIGKAFMVSRRLLKQHQVDAVISVGGFSAAPASFAALSRHLPFFIHEQNASMGRLNRLLKPHATQFFSSYDAASPVKSYPVNAALFEKARIRSGVHRVIFLGGSQGAAFINDLALALAPSIAAKGIAITHQCGDRDYERVKAAYEAMRLDVELVDFTKALPDLLEKSDFAISRAGASTLWELCANGLPAYFIPYPYAAGDHQYHNARFLVEKGLGWCARQKEVKHDELLALLDEGLSERSERLMRLIERDGADQIIEQVEMSVNA
jgi:UDP-N-acetylglucosamine--N-acetylmuramyl-(pentapeptide) pyrophosphoryl-undecaprenol N-acetylglucosamine transferase